MSRLNKILKTEVFYTVAVYSDTSQGIGLTVETWFEESQADLKMSRFPFTLFIQLKNERFEDVRISRRVWSIRERGYQPRLVEGNGIGGYIPLILPGKTLEYQITVPFLAANIALRGTYMVTVFDSGEAIYVSTPVFTMSAHIFN